MVEPERIKRLKEADAKKGDFVLYWMQASQRSEYNHALDYTILEANARSLPLVTFFGITDRFPEANLRHYTFFPGPCNADQPRPGSALSLSP